MDALVDHLFYIYRGIFELNTYHSRWLELLMLVLRKIGKTDYTVAKHAIPSGSLTLYPKGFQP
jgi:hypothetical protein